MIYEYLVNDEPIRQGDIFQRIPRIDLDLSQLPVVINGKTYADDWLNSSSNNDLIQAVVGVRSVTAIVITQDCDAVRIDDIALCEIASFKEVEGLAKDANKPKAYMSLITKQSRLNLKWFYLPPDSKIGFKEKMAVDFQTVIPASRSYLEKNASTLRLGRLNEIASEHFREKLSEFYRRFAYDEWYPLDKEELNEYKKDKPGPIIPFPWQQ